MLYVSGVHASVFDATAVLIAVAALGVLPVGPGVGTAAMVLILGSTGVAGVSAAGVLLTATGTVGALAYGGWALADRLWTKRTTRRRLRASGDRPPSTSADPAVVAEVVHPGLHGGWLVWKPQSQGGHRMKLARQGPSQRQGSRPA